MLIAYIAAGAVMLLFFAAFAIGSIRERKPRAAAISVISLALVTVTWYLLYHLLESLEYVLLIPPAVVIAVIAAFLLPVGSIRSIRIDDTSERVDERDVVFAREEYHSGTEKYDRYYAEHPELKDVDDQMRSLPELLEPGGRYYDPVRSKGVDEIFDEIQQLLSKVDGEVNPQQTPVDETAMSAAIKKRTLELGADEVGIAVLNQAYVYSHVGRGLDKWGEPIVNNHHNAVAFTLEMDHDSVEQAPCIPITEETARNYHKAALISISLAEWIRSIGYPARAHISGSNYQIVLAPVAHDAGLGELGRHGYLISRRFGSRIRLGAVTTDLPLVTDKPVAFGVQDFCDRCLKCAVNCPSASIPLDGQTVIRGIEKWQLDAESCIHYWRKIGTDCGICMKVCPFSHPRSVVHDLVRTGIGRSAFARWISVYGDDLFYGKRFRPPSSCH